MNFKSRKQLNFDESERFKLYKSGKLWLVTGLTFFSFLGGALISNPTIHADVTATVKTTSSESSSSATSSSANSVNTYSNAASQDSTTNTSSATNTSTSDATNTNSTNDSTKSTTVTSGSSSQASTSSSTTNTSAASEASTSTATSATTSSAATSTSSASEATSSAATSSTVSSEATSSAATSSVTSSVSASSTVTSSASAATTVAPVASRIMAVAESLPVEDTWTIGDTTRPTVDAVDVSSYQADMTQSDFNTLKSLGVKTVIVKATEGTTYTNPAAVSEAKMADQAGLNVDFYHYADFTTSTEATAEASNLVNFLTTNNVSKQVLIFADMESSTATASIASSLNTFWSALTAAGYTNHGVYTFKDYQYANAVAATVGNSRVWMAQYPYTPTNTTRWNSDMGAWQFSSKATLPSGSTYTGDIDVSIDYTGLLSDSAGTATFGNSSTTNTGTPTNTSTNTSTNSGDTINTGTTVKAESGTYKFTGTTAIKSAASDSAATVGTYYKGSTVRYNAKVTANGETWLRYLAASGAQRFVKIAASTSSSTSSNTSTSSETIKATTGTYKFTGTTAIKSAASDSASTVGTYYIGSTVRYDAKITKNGETWLRYLAASGAQRYVKIAGAKTTTSTSTNNSSASSETIKSETGVYKFTGTTAIKSAANDSASTVGTYYKGSTVRYDAKITKNGQTWLRYLAASGAQRYVKISGTTTTSSASTTNNTSETVQAATGTYKFTGTTAIKSAASDSASTVGTYYQGSTVRYNAKITKNGQTWLRYLAASGAQRYVKVSGATTTTSTKASSTTTSNKSGYYTFKTNTNIRTGASLNASIVGEYYTGDSVHYLGTVSADGYQWMKYLATSGSYRYVAIVD